MEWRSGDYAIVVGVWSALRRMYGSVHYDVVEYFIHYVESRVYIVRRVNRRTANERGTGNYLGNHQTIASFLFLRLCHFISACRCFPTG